MSEQEMNRQPHLLQGTLDMMILKVLSLEAAHGYDIVRRIHAASGEVLLVEEGSLYPALHRLEKRKYLSSEWRRSPSNRRAKYYLLTGRGRRALGSETNNWSTVATAIDRVMGTVARRGGAME